MNALRQWLYRRRRMAWGRKLNGGKLTFNGKGRAKRWA